jgi:hypothetical protein
MINRPRVGRQRRGIFSGGDGLTRRGRTPGVYQRQGRSPASPGPARGGGLGPPEAGHLRTPEELVQDVASLILSDGVAPADVELPLGRPVDALDRAEPDERVLPSELRSLASVEHERSAARRGTSPAQDLEAALY